MCKAFPAMVLLVWSLAAKAQYAGYGPVSDLSAFREQFSLVSRNTHSIQSDFIQEKNLSMLSETIKSTGKFWFKKDNLVRMEYQTPFRYLLIINKNNIYVKDGNQENKVSASSNKLFRQINQITVDCIQGTVLDNADFKFRVFQNEKNFLVELTPVDKQLKAYFRSIIVTVAKKDYAVSKVDMIELSGDNTLINFVNKELNVTIPDALFTIH